MPDQFASSWTNTPGYLKPIFFEGPNSSFQQFGTFQKQAPTIAELANMVPGLNVPDLTPEQQAIISQLEAAGANTTDIQNARQQLAQLTSGPIGSSPETQAGMEAFQKLTLPSIEQVQALQGTSQGGAAVEAAAQGATAAAVPLIGQEIQNRMNAVQLGPQLQQDQIQQLAASLEAAGLQREVALQQAQAQLEQQQQKWGYESQLQTFPLQMMQDFLGHGSMNKSVPTAWDYVGSVGQALQPSGGISNLIG